MALQGRLEKISSLASSFEERQFGSVTASWPGAASVLQLRSQPAWDQQHRERLFPHPSASPCGRVNARGTGSSSWMSTWVGLCLHGASGSLVLAWGQWKSCLDELLEIGEFVLAGGQWKSCHHVPVGFWRVANRGTYPCAMEMGATHPTCWLARGPVRAAQGGAALLVQSTQLRTCSE